MINSFCYPQFHCFPQDMSLTADLRLTLMPIVHIVPYDIIPFEVEIDPYIGVMVEKYATGAGPRRAPCTQNVTETTKSDLWFSLYYGVDAVFRLARPATGPTFQIFDSIDGLFNGIVFACRTAAAVAMAGCWPLPIARDLSLPTERSLSPLQ